MNLQEDILKKLIHQILAEESGELGCPECCDLMDKFAEIKLAGHIPALEMPLVQEHLNHCDNCREQYDMLVDALRSLYDNPS